MELLNEINSHCPKTSTTNFNALHLHFGPKQVFTCFLNLENDVSDVRWHVATHFLLHIFWTKSTGIPSKHNDVDTTEKISQSFSRLFG